MSLIPLNRTETEQVKNLFGNDPKSTEQDTEQYRTDREIRQNQVQKYRTRYRTDTEQEKPADPVSGRGEKPLKGFPPPLRQLSAKARISLFPLIENLKSKHSEIPGALELADLFQRASTGQPVDFNQIKAKGYEVAELLPNGPLSGKKLEIRLTEMFPGGEFKPVSTPGNP